MAESTVVIKDLGIDQLYNFIVADPHLGRNVAQVFKDNKISGDLISALTDDDVQTLLPNLLYGAKLRLRQLCSQHTQPVTIKGDKLDVKTANLRDSDSEAARKVSKSEETNPFSQLPINVMKNVHSHQDAKFQPLINLAHDGNSPTAIYIVGEQSQVPHVEEKVLLLVGATGVGKGTLVNAIGNFLYGVQWEDERFTVTPEIQKSQTSSQTSQISVYKFVHQKEFPLPYSVTVIDTPGFGGTGGLQKDKDIASQLKHLLNHASIIKYLDVLALVVKATDARASSVQKSILHKIQQHFGKDIQNNIFVVATHADSSHVRALDGLKEAGFPFTKEHVFPVNNVVLYAPTTSEDEDEAKINHLTWDRNIKTYMKMFDALQVMKRVSIHQTQKALEERECLARVLENLKHQICHAAQQGITKTGKRKTEVEQRSTENQTEIDYLLQQLNERLIHLQKISLSNSQSTLTGYIKGMMEEETAKPSKNNDAVMTAFKELHRKAQHLMKKPSVSEDTLL